MSTSSSCGTCEIGEEIAQGIKDIMFGLDLKKIVPGGGRSRFGSQDNGTGDDGGGGENDVGNHHNGDENTDSIGDVAFQQDDEDRARLEALTTSVDEEAISAAPPSNPRGGDSKIPVSSDAASAAADIGEAPSSPPGQTMETESGNKKTTPKRSPKRLFKAIIRKKSTGDEKQQQQQQQNHVNNEQLASKNSDSDENVSENLSPADDEVQDVNQMLADMEIPDFNLSVDFDEISKGSSSSNNKTKTNDKGQMSTERLDREEVFSRRYHPSAEESKELQELATALGATSSITSYTSTIASNLYDLLHGNHSIILMRGPVVWNDRDCELILLSDGFVLAYRDYNSYNPLESRYETCLLWNDVGHVTTAKVGRLTISPSKGSDFELMSSSDGPSIMTWFSYIEQVLISSAINDPKSTIAKDDIGWQYRVIHKPGYTAAVLGDMRLMGSPSNPSTDLNTPDDYNESTPLHYAMQADPCDANIVEALLRFGADPNKPDGDGRTAMYFAQRNQLDDVEAILKPFGARKSSLAEMELRGELFGGVEEAQQRTNLRREKEQAIKDQKAAETADKAQTAQSQMSKNMAAMIERGEKIQEMDDKARQLNAEAKDFGDMAKQLKREMKNKKWYQL